jgi:F-type H+-transporting ATPase subunit a
MEATKPHISIKGEQIFEIGHYPISNSVIASAIVLVVFILLATTYYNQSISKKKGLFYYGVNEVLTILYDMLHGVLENKIKFFFALLASYFFFILMNNWSGLIPGFGSILIKVTEHGEEHMVPLLRAGTADLNTTFALAMTTVFTTQIFGFRFLGPIPHLSKYFNFKDPVMLFVGILELILEGARILSFAFRLYGNIFAGEVLLSIIPFLLPIFLGWVTSPMYFMEIFVGMVQAFVFVILSTIFINMATSHGH